MADVLFEKASRIYPGSDKIAVDAVDLHIDDGEFLVLVGPSGCGKSTCLRMLAGLEDVDEGKISIGGVDVTDLKPKDRDIAMVFQNYALYPHLVGGERPRRSRRHRDVGVRREHGERNPGHTGGGRRELLDELLPGPGGLRRCSGDGARGRRRCVRTVIVAAGGERKGDRKPDNPAARGQSAAHARHRTEPE
jgi:ABC transporter